MKGVDRLTMRVALWAIPVPCIVSLLLTFFSPCKRDLIYFSIVGVALIRTDVFLIQSGIPIPHGMFNRNLGVLVLRGVALGLNHGKPVQEGLLSAETI